ncbi:MAG: site-2 protease family protein [Candidatus Wildermuthbacteria bacterium]|nr:site-2 protease family protein [Candidatus Wildermuthbacteria bacterium]MBI2121074.1 site-2 protease family protein [Candidatus Wildermuthbacteria bacterium]MBI2647863.1 site-2 protease family protein [Candidatus Wildermuthbacteria bacterium]
MTSSIIVAIGGLIFLVILHELGHFLIAKKLGVRVDEFGIGYPPKLWGIKRGGTEYSLNLLPFGAFVRLAGEEDESADSGSYRAQPLWGKALILSGGVIAFWIVAWALYSILAGTSGIVTAVADEAINPRYEARVQILGVAPGSPAEASGLMPGDTILAVGRQEKALTVSLVQEEVNLFRGKDLTILLERNGTRQSVSLEPRLTPPSDQGPAGIMLALVQNIRSPWYTAPLKGGQVAGEVTLHVVRGLGVLLKSLIFDRQALSGVEVQGPVGITRTLSLSLAQGASSFLSLLALIAVYLAVFNLIPLPVTDGGKLFLIFIQSITGKTIPVSAERVMNAAVFSLLLLLMIWVTIKDIMRIW